MSEAVDASEIKAQFFFYCCRNSGSCELIVFEIIALILFYRGVNYA